MTLVWQVTIRRVAGGDEETTQGPDAEAPPNWLYDEILDTVRACVARGEELEGDDVFWAYFDDDPDIDRDAGEKRDLRHVHVGLTHKPLILFIPEWNSVQSVWFRRLSGIEAVGLKRSADGPAAYTSIMLMFYGNERLRITFANAGHAAMVYRVVCGEM
jgi:hypothetical protein